MTLQRIEGQMEGSESNGGYCLEVTITSRNPKINGKPERLKQPVVGHRRTAEWHQCFVDSPRHRMMPEKGVLTAEWPMSMVNEKREKAPLAGSLEHKIC